jgi:hypothetical protein
MPTPGTLAALTSTDELEPDDPAADAAVVGAALLGVAVVGAAVVGDEDVFEELEQAARTREPPATRARAPEKNVRLRVVGLISDL